ncbi:MAG: DNA polymerase-3 subunit alpha (Gram-positive type) [Kiritimatiellia bacterium]|jgi:DNA polymerase III subunit alpha, Gram-positive type
MLRNLITISLIAWQFASADINETNALAEILLSLDDTTFVAIDTETTGLNPQLDRIIEIGVVKFKAGKIIERKDWLIDPEMTIPLEAINVHGITDEMVKGKPHFKEVYPKLIAFIKDTTLLAHNAAFDERFLEVETNRLEKTPSLTNPVICTIRLCRTWFPELKSYQLSELVKTFDLEPGEYHRALGDAEHLSHLFIHATGTLGHHL